LVKPNAIVAIVFRERDKKKEFLLLHRVLNWTGWELLKGHIDGKDSQNAALKKELFEEAGIFQTLKTKKLPIVLNYFNSRTKKEMHSQAFLVQVSEQTIVSLANNDPKEHDSFEWLPAKIVLERITFENQRKVFEATLKELGVSFA
jgi:8-oxo-dGTP pyrophosphatase MutT (NUDIX family)